MRRSARRKHTAIPVGLPSWRSRRAVLVHCSAAGGPDDARFSGQDGVHNRRRRRVRARLRQGAARRRRECRARRPRRARAGAGGRRSRGAAAIASSDWFATPPIEARSNRRRRRRFALSGACISSSTTQESAAAAPGLEELTAQDWEWVIRVNLMTVAHGVAIFLPHLRAHGEGGHFVNTASMAGHARAAANGALQRHQGRRGGLVGDALSRIEGDEYRRQRVVPGLRQDGHRRRAAQPAGARGVAGFQGGGGSGGAGSPAPSSSASTRPRSPRALCKASATRIFISSLIPTCGRGWTRGSSAFVRPTTKPSASRARPRPPLRRAFRRP